MTARFAFLLTTLSFATLSFATLSFFPASATADVVIGARTSIGGGVGSSPRPVYGALAGIDATVTSARGIGLSATYDRVVVERPDEPGGTETQASVFVSYQLKKRDRSAFFAVGGGVRKLRVDSGDPLLGDVTLTGFNLLHFRSGVDWNIGDRARLGFAFDWIIGGYSKGSYDDPSAFTDERDQPPPKVKAWSRWGGSNIYTFGPRLSFVLD